MCCLSLQLVLFVYSRKLAKLQNSEMDSSDLSNGFQSMNCGFRGDTLMSKFISHTAAYLLLARCRLGD